jgi:hypothetical protein
MKTIDSETELNPQGARPARFRKPTTQTRNWPCSPVFHQSFCQISYQSQTPRSWYSYSSQWNTYRGRLCWYLQSTCFFQLLNKPSLLTTPMSQSQTTLALTWTSIPESKFWLKESQHTSLRYHLVEIPAYKLLIFNPVSLLVNTWQLCSFFLIFNETFQLKICHVSFIRRLLSISEW